MTAIELKMSLLQEVMSLEDEQLSKKALDSSPPYEDGCLW